MFDVPNAKRIKRSDFEAEQRGDDGPLEDATALSEIDDQDTSTLKSGHIPMSYGFEYDFITPQHSGPQKPPAEQSEADQQYEFRLFSTPTGATATPVEDHQGNGTTSTTNVPPRIITLARSPTPSSALPEQAGRFLCPRPDTHYLTDPSSSLRAQYAATAISPTTLLTLAQTPWPGTALVWRSAHLPLSQIHKCLRSSSSTHHRHTTTTTNRRPKPSKKRRILLRQRLAARLRSQPKPKPTKIVNEKGELELDLPPEEREKRTARNREKKLKRRDRERQKKEAAGLAANGSGGGDGDVGDGVGAAGTGDTDGVLP
ncbi:uncharacterized protein AB675_11437 [Cyphellophora attinorum]|uniref:Uncharacterized protein n=1 Tax=Cyphellophora attinorum TaxID=1664694 RepID=A0A0N1H9F3_9EURO|nr:uncharacterized protein AB675_11437 [Phialophora attinorum]KPI40205.1 hypothetical protein AB675_11437 [Phialophora attinorum]